MLSRNFCGTYLILYEFKTQILSIQILTKVSELRRISGLVSHLNQIFS